MIISVIIQARMGSTRLPGKVMMKLKGGTVLEHVINRVKASRRISDIIIATTVDEKDNAIVEEAKRLNVKYYRGSEDDVLSRYYYAARENSSDVIIRITSDCPCIDPDVLDKMIEKFTALLHTDGVDYLSNTNTTEKTYPRGLDVEIFTFKALERVFQEANKPYQREHVTPYIYQNPDKFILSGYKNDTDYSNYRWTLDTIEDYKVIEKIYDNLYKDDKLFYLEDMVKLMERCPEIPKINESIEQKKLEE